MSIVRWVGGKRALLPALVARAPRTFNRYYEPFAGGAAMFFALAPPRAVLADDNVDLIGTYRAVADDPGRVLDELRRHRGAHSEPHFYAVRAWWNQTAGLARGRYAGGVDPVARAAAFLYLNAVSFNALWRVSSTNEHNAPWGDRPFNLPERELRSAALALRAAEFRTGDFRSTLRDVAAGDFVYMDPPYDGTFTSYTSSRFSDADQVAVAQVAYALAARGARVMISNSDTPRTRALYAPFRIEHVVAPRRVNPTADRSVVELVAMVGYDVDEQRAARAPSNE